MIPVFGWLVRESNSVRRPESPIFEFPADMFHQFKFHIISRSAHHRYSVEECIETSTGVSQSVRGLHSAVASLGGARGIDRGGSLGG